MENVGCNNGCGNDSAKLFGCDLHSEVSGERKITSPGNSIPPLPEPVLVTAVKSTTGPDDRTEPDARRTVEGLTNIALHRHTGDLQEGCHYIRLIPTSLHTPARFQYEGTLRFQRTGRTGAGAMIASGDLYKKDFCDSPTFCPSFSADEDEKISIPVFPRKQYAYFLRITRLQADLETGKRILLEMEPYRFEHSNHTWTRGEPLTAELNFSTGSDGIHYWRGDVRTGSDIVMGHMVAVRISSFLRQAVVEIDRVAESECPEENEIGNDWKSIFKKAGWDVTIDISDDDIKLPEDHIWNNAELHKKMLEYREKVALDVQWRYHLMAVPNLGDGAFGVMYDNTVKGINGIPREGAAVASHVMVPDEEHWGKSRGQRFGAFKDLYFRTAIHEIGHAMMLYHPDNPYENYLMQKTIQIAHNVRPPQQFPDNIQWSFSPRDIHMLCHLPDIAIRPGGVCFGTPHQRLPVNARDEVVEANGLELRVDAQPDVVPIGAPVRVNFILTNRSNQVKKVPGSLRIKSGHVSGRVIDPLGSSQDFATIIRYTNRNKKDVLSQDLQPGQSIAHSATLLWGTEGPLFPTSGFYRVILELNWYLEGVRFRIAGSDGVMVTPPKDNTHARAALKIFSTPNVLLALAIGGDHNEEGYEVIRNAMNHAVLKPHYDLVEAKRVGQNYFREREPKLKDTADIVNEDTVMSPTEVIRLTKILKSSAKETEKDVVKKMSNLLLTKSKGTTVEKIVGDMINEIQE
jgi:hypothetical protein